MAGCHTIHYQGNEILFFDHVGLRGQAIIDNLRVGNQMMLASSKTDYLILSDFTGTYGTDEIVAYLLGAESQAASKRVKKSAVVGVTGIKKIFLNMYNAVAQVQVKPFETREAAQEYLIA